MENKLPTAEEFLTNKYEFDLNSFQDNVEHLKEFAKLHVEKIKDLQQSKYYAGETGYIKKEEWEELLTNIK